MKSSAKEFRETYGDYFVAGYKRSASIRGPFVFEAESVEKITQFTSEVKGKLGEISADATLALSNASKKHNVCVTVEWTHGRHRPYTEAPTH